MMFAGDVGGPVLSQTLFLVYILSFSAPKPKAATGSFVHCSFTIHIGMIRHAHVDEP